MSESIDGKKIGLSVKDLLMGVVGVAAGATAGSAGAQAANKIDTGLDGILDSAGVKKEAPPSRINPERTDFSARQSALGTREQSIPKQQVLQVLPDSVETPALPESPARPQMPTTHQRPEQVPAKVSEELMRLGYSEEEVAEIAQGRYLHAASGQTTTGAAGRRLTEQPAIQTASSESKKTAGYEGFSLGSVMGMLKGLGSG